MGFTSDYDVFLADITFLGPTSAHIDMGFIFLIWKAELAKLAFSGTVLAILLFVLGYNVLFKFQIAMFAFHLLMFFLVLFLLSFIIISLANPTLDPISPAIGLMQMNFCSVRHLAAKNGFRKGIQRKIPVRARRFFNFNFHFKINFSFYNLTFL